MTVQRNLLMLGVVATVSACSALRTTGVPPSSPPGQVLKYPYACNDRCLPISTRVLYTPTGGCKTEFLVKEITAVKGKDVVWKIDAAPGGTFRFKEIRDVTGRLTRPGIAIDELDQFPDFDNPRYGSTQAEYIWTASPRTTKHRHEYKVYVELQFAKESWQECETGDPVIESN